VGRAKTPYILLAVLLAGAGSGVGLGLSEAPTGPTDAAAVLAVEQGLRATEAAGTASLTLGTDLNLSSVRGPTPSITGRGVIDFRNGDQELEVRIAAKGFSFSVTTLEVGGAGYLKMHVSGPEPVTVPLPGNEWYAMGKPPSVPGHGNAPNVFGFLGTPGNSVRAIGSRTIDGMASDGYAVVVPQASMRRDLGPTLAQVPPSLRPQYRGLVQSLARIDVWIDRRGLIRRLSLDAGVLVLTLEDFGVPVHLAAPPPSEVSHSPLGGILPPFALQFV
jgi:hypothetical protein